MTEIKEVVDAPKKLQAHTKDGYLWIGVPTQAPALSKSGKSMVVATTSGNKQVMINNKWITIGVNAYTPAE